MPKIGEIKNGRHIGRRSASRHIFVACEGCGKQRWVLYSVYQKGRLKLCSSCMMKKSRKKLPHYCGEKHWNWTGGKYISKGKYKGYVQIYVAKNSPYYQMVGSRPYIPEHRLIMAKYLGRCLAKTELVHHKNGCKTDNRIENLELTTNGQHCKDHHRGYKAGLKKGWRDLINSQICLQPN